MKILCSCLLLIGLVPTLEAQTCNDPQSLTVQQESQIGLLLNPLDTALKYEDLFHIDSLTNEIKLVFSTEGGQPEDTENGSPLIANTTWVDLPNALLLSRELIDADAAVYADLWKAAKGMAPPAYLPHSLFLRASAEIAAGLLQIADNETDLSRKAQYELWATRALDSLATMQLPSGAFPFPDLREYGDPTFMPIIQNFLNACGDDSVLVLQNGWIVDDRGTGEFKFDAGVIADSYYQAYLYTGNLNYRDLAISIADYLQSLSFNFNYNYNTFVVLGLTRAYQLTADDTYLNRVVKNLRYSVYPGQLENGRWVDGHNANSRYHSIIVRNSAPIIPLIPITDSYKTALDLMTLKAVKNLLDYSMICGTVTGYRWLMKAYQLPASVIPNTLHDSISDQIGRHINQSVFDASYLDVPTIGEYLELLSVVGLNEQANETELKSYPNPFTETLKVSFQLADAGEITIQLVDLMGKVVYLQQFTATTLGKHEVVLTPDRLANEMYRLVVNTGNQSCFASVYKVD
ncbi:MAG: hypothetical protein QE487_17465 [Fluviicola sp.]|nr:hypothetical protein [Fluviicola sp.]